MNGGLEKYLYFNSVEVDDGGRPEPGSGDDKKRRELEEQAYNNEKLYFKLAEGWAANATTFKITGKKGIAADMLCNLVDSKTLAPTTKSATFMTNEIVASIGNAAYISSSNEYAYAITCDTAMTAAFNQETDDINNYYVEVKNADNTGIDATARGQSVCYPVDRFKGWLNIEAGRSITDPKKDRVIKAGKNMIAMVFEPLIGAPTDTVADSAYEHYDYVFLEVKVGSQLEVIKAVTRAINGNRKATSDGFISVFDAIRNDTLTPDIKAIAIQLSVQ